MSYQQISISLDIEHPDLAYNKCNFNLFETKYYYLIIS